MSISTDTWTNTNGGSWFTAGDWSAGVPNALSNAVITSGSTPLTVTYNGTDTVNGLSTDSGTTLDITGGILTVLTGTNGNIGGVYSTSGNANTTLSVSGGTFDSATGFSVSGYAALGTAGTLESDSGVLTLQNGASLAGNLTGAGAINLDDIGIFTLAAGVNITVANLQVTDGATAMLGGNLTYANNYLQTGGDGSSSTLQLGGNTLTLTGAATFGQGSGFATSIAGPGTVLANGATTVNGLTIAGGAVLEITGTADQNGSLSIGSSGADTALLKIDGGATYDITTASTVTEGQSGVGITNAGTFEATAASGTSVVSAAITSTGTVSDTGGILYFENNGGTFSGALTGSGVIGFASGGTYTLATGATVTVATWALRDTTTTVLGENLSYAGSFLLGNTAGSPTLSLGGNTLTFTGSFQAAGAYINGPGSVVIASGATGADTANFLTVEGNAVLEVAGTMTQGATLSLGNSGTDTAALKIDAGATYDITTASNINASAGTDSITNAGTLEVNSNTGTSTIYANTTSTGTVDAVSGTLSFQAGGSFSGTLSGAGTLDLRGGANYTLGTKATTLSVATLGIFDAGTVVTMAGGLSYAGAFTLGAGATLNTGSSKFFVASGTNDVLNGTVSGAGAYEASGATDVNGLALTGSAKLIDTKTIAQDGTLSVGVLGTDKATLQINLKSTYTITNDSSINVGGLSTVVNGGLFEKAGGIGTSVIAAPFTNNNVVEALSGTLSFNTVVNNGSILAQGGQVTFETVLSSGAGHTGTVKIGANGVAFFNAGANSSESVLFTATTGELTLNAPSSAFAAAISGFTIGDTVRLLNTSATALKVTVVSTSLTTVEVLNGANQVLTLDFKGNYTGKTFTLAVDPNGGYDITDPLAGSTATAPAPITAKNLGTPTAPHFAAASGGSGGTPDWTALFSTLFHGAASAGGGSAPGAGTSEITRGGAVLPFWAESHASALLAHIGTHLMAA